MIMNLGIGDWGLGIGDWAQSQSPIPNPQSPNFLNKINNNCILFFQYILIIKRKKNVIYAIKSIYTLIEYKYFNNSLSSINFNLLNI